MTTQDPLETASMSELWKTVRDAIGTDLGLFEMLEPLEALDSLRTQLSQMEAMVEAHERGLERLEAVVDRTANDLLKAELERNALRAVVEAARIWAERDDVWFAANEVRPFDAERVTATSLAKRKAATELRRALSSLPEETAAERLSRTGAETDALAEYVERKGLRKRHE